MNLTIRSNRLVWLLVVPLMVAAGCATPARYSVGVSTYQGAYSDLRSRPIGVATNARASNPLMAAEVRSKIEQLLRDRGYRVVPLEEAELVVLNIFGIGSPEEIATGGVVLPFRNMLAYVPTSRTEYFRWLMLGVATKDVLNTPGMQASAIPWNWVAEVSSSGSSGDLRVVIDAMLVAALEHFGSSTGRRVVVEISENDARLKRLGGQGGSKQ